MTPLKLLLFGLVLLTLPYAVSAQSQAGPPLERFHGTWQGDGKAFGMTARVQLRWEPVLSNKFVRLSLRNEISRPGGQTQVFEGHAYYQPTGQTSATSYDARWFDSRGLSFPIRANLEGDSLVALWGSPETEEGKSTYRLIAPEKLEVVDSVKQKDGTWKEFGRFVVTRQ